MNKYEPVIGLEIHVELSTKSKMFCRCSADYFDLPPNSNTCPVCLGLPGSLPVPNRKAVEWTIKIGQALNCKINTFSKFDRKHYFYPDLNKGIQISQLDNPIAGKGELRINTPEGMKKFGITRVHLEEDAGKLIHKEGKTLVDANRAGVPLVEIVTEPDFRSSEEVKRFLEELHTIITFLDVSDADLEKGSMRMEPNISLRLKGTKEYPKYKVEVKNINSFNFAKKAVDYEIKRQAEILEKGDVPPQETRGYDESKGATVSQRSKEGAQDYRYFPEPDIPPMRFSKELLKRIKDSIPRLPSERMQHFMNDFGIKESDAFQLSRTKELSDYFEKVITLCQAERRVGKDSIENLEQKIANLIVNKKIIITDDVPEFVERALKELKPTETDLGSLHTAIETVLENNASAVDDYKQGKENIIMFLLGQVMRKMKGKADAQVVMRELKQELS